MEARCLAPKLSPMIVYPRAYTSYARNFFTEFFPMANEETISNPDHKCRTSWCMKPMPLPQMWGMACNNCGHRQPTLDELKRRLPEVFPPDPNSIDTPLDVVHV